MDIRYSKNTERPVAEIVKEHFSLAINKAAGEYDRNLTDIVLYAGDEYKVKHNGSEYTCVAYEKDGAIHIGGESEPFDIYNFAGDIYAKAETDGANTFEVHHEKINGLPAEFLPVNHCVVTVTVKEFTTENPASFEVEYDKPIEEILNADALTIYVDFDGGGMLSYGVPNVKMSDNSIIQYTCPYPSSPSTVYTGLINADTNYLAIG